MFFETRCVRCVCDAVDMDKPRSEDESKPSTSVQTEQLQGSPYDDDHHSDVRPPYEHVDHLTQGPPQTDRAAADQPPSSLGGAVDYPPEAPPRQAEQRLQRPRWTTKCRVIPIVVSGQSTARLGQLCYETTAPADARRRHTASAPRPWRHGTNSVLPPAE